MIGRTERRWPHGLVRCWLPAALAFLMLLFSGCGPQADWNTLNEQAKQAASEDRDEEAEKLWKQALGVAEETGDELQQNMTLNNLGEFHRAQGRLDLAVPYYLDALEIYERNPGIINTFRWLQYFSSSVGAGWRPPE